MFPALTPRARFSWGQALSWSGISLLFLTLILLSTLPNEWRPQLFPVLLLWLGGMALVLCLGSSWLCLQGAMLTLFTGILTSVPLGFTLKGPQLFALLGLMAWGLAWLRGERPPPLPRGWAKPFLLFGLCILPSLLLLKREQMALGEAETSMRLLFNYAWLQLFTLLLLLEVHSPARLQRALKLAGISFLASLLFGYAQQIGYYAGVYDPQAWVGRHSSIVDFYGPFLRLSPGTFANEYGEILQTMALLLLGWLYLRPKPTPATAKPRGLLSWLLPHLMLAWLLLSLILNFSRASWLVFALGAFALLLLARVRLWALVSLSLLGSLSLALLWYLSQILLAASVLLSVGQRFQELSEFQAHSLGERLVSWQLAWEAFLKSPWIGQGWGLFPGTHNVPLQLLAETGLLGCLAFYSLMGWAAWQMFRGWRRAQAPELKALQLTLLVALLGCLAFDLSNHGIYHFVLWFSLGMGLACARLNLASVPPAQAGERSQPNTMETS